MSTVKLLLKDFMVIVHGVRTSVSCFGKFMIGGKPYLTMHFGKMKSEWK